MWTDQNNVKQDSKEQYACREEFEEEDANNAGDNYKKKGKRAMNKFTDEKLARLFESIRKCEARSVAEDTKEPEIIYIGE